MSSSLKWKSSLVAALALGFAIGCASGGKPQALRADQVGAYRFTERVAEDVTLEGTFVIEPDTLSIDATPGPCHYDKERSSAIGVSYSCGDVAYSFDRFDPLRSARYTAVVHLKETKSVCIRYTVTSSGQQVCAQSRNETVYRDVRRSGLLRPQRVDPEAP